MGRRLEVADLSDREREILVLLGRERLTYKEAATRLPNAYDEDRTLSPATVRTYAAALYEKLGGTGRQKSFLVSFYYEHREAIEDGVTI